MLPERRFCRRYRSVAPLISMGSSGGEAVLENVLSKEDATSMASLLEIIVILWRSIRKALDQNEEAKNYTISKFASVLPEYFRVFKVRMKKMSRLLLI
ncbi:hypothetical protein AB205_0160610 [Aquarana catesbeiana]|uniref:Uncharacterized protein n=1 Tax=Aquarana catesbeiana TaxID=8400 RepID=A0A2G9SHQ8_AQUCT|nr:hypothetical protein AB205_0160610 [Aquarana catesbeiana]